ncbi:RNA recognition motif domain-containing protein [Ditylenchus destructor]|nr:RNA recognition motif domain-containing protein [Ditylenchus destructor]
MDLQLTKYFCSICQNLPQPVIFSNIHDLEVHVANHFSHTPYECGVCIKLNQPYKFSTENSLLRHYSQCHPETKRFYILKYHSAETREVGDEVLIRLHESVSLSSAWQNTNNLIQFNEGCSNSEPITHSETYDQSSNNNKETTTVNTKITLSDKLTNTKSVQNDFRDTSPDFKLLLKEEINDRSYETSALRFEITNEQEMNVANGISSQPQEDYDSNSFNPNADNEFQPAQSESAQNTFDNHMTNERCVSIFSDKYEMPPSPSGPNDQSPSNSRLISPRREHQTTSHSRSTSQQECFRKLYVTNLGSLTCQEIENAFANFGELADIWVAYDSFYACVTFKRYKDAHKALKQMRSGNIQQQKIRTTVTNPRSKRRHKNT